MPNLYEDAEVPDGVELYDFEDHAKHRELIFNDAASALQKQFPKVHNGVRMEVADVQYVDPENYDFKSQKEALHKDKYLTRRLRGTIRLTDEATGELLDEKKNTTLMRVPYLTDRGTFIRDGNEWGSIAQQRLLPGAYSRFQANGELETQFNVRPGTGSTFKVNFHPETTLYKFSVGGSELHMYSLMRDIGVSDDELKSRWGDEIFAANAAKYDPRTLDRAYNKIVPDWDKQGNPNRSREEKAAIIKRALDKAQVATNVVKTTLPNLFDRTKSAAWARDGEMLTKCASLSKNDLEDIAYYISQVTGKPVSADNKEELIQKIRNVVNTGDPNLTANKGVYDESDVAATAVRSMRAHRVYTRILETVKKMRRRND